MKKNMRLTIKEILIICSVILIVCCAAILFSWYWIPMAFYSWVTGKNTRIPKYEYHQM